MTEDVHELASSERKRLFVWFGGADIGECGVSVSLHGQITDRNYTDGPPILNYGDPP
jgi:hypothetical protein